MTGMTAPADQALNPGGYCPIPREFNILFWKSSRRNRIRNCTAVRPPPVRDEA
jgi:hypothetical protein